MDDGTQSLAQAIGARVKHERQSKKWTLDQLATAAGVSRRMVVNVETGSVNPSVGTLLRLSDALNVGLPALVEPPVPKPVKITRHGEGAVLWVGDSGGRGMLVSTFGRPDVLALWDWTLEPGERHASEAHNSGTREVLQVIAGEIVVEVNAQPHSLGTGDALSFPGDEAHSYLNPNGQPARFSLAVFDPGVGAEPL